VRLADFDAPEMSESGGQLARAALSRIAMGRRLWCATVNPRRKHAVRSHNRVVAVCWRDGLSLGELLRDTGAAEGGR
jgi:endonuclease YncB( thermonuclease family)